MAITIPLIRAANLLPIVKWLEVNNQPVERNLKDADLDYWFNLAPHDPVPTINAVTFLRDAARANGPDLGYRIVNEASISELAYIGRVALGSRTPKEALARVAAALPLHSSHEDIRLIDNGETIVVRQVLTMKLDDESIHAVHVLFAALIQQLCRFTGIRPPLFNRVEMQAHPVFGFSHLEDWLGDQVAQSMDGAINLHISSGVANAPFRVIAKDRLPRLMAMGIPPLAEDRSLAGSMRPAIAAMLHGGEPTIARLVQPSGMSIRSIQRRLAEEGTSFSTELDKVRRSMADKLLLQQDSSISDIATRLGYSSHSALTRAIRRWTGTTPSWIKQNSPPEILARKV